jgi:hypothetical protein
MKYFFRSGNNEQKSVKTEQKMGKTERKKYSLAQIEIE